MQINKPNNNENFGFFSNYINKVTTNNLVEGLIENQKIFTEKILSLSTEQLQFSYAPGKWTLQQSVGHIIDVERIFSYRILRFARKDKTPLPGFDENFYVENSTDGTKEIGKLMAEFNTVRQSTIALIDGLDTNILDEIGMANNLPITPRAIGYACLGHCIHHIGIIDDRYLAY